MITLHIKYHKASNTFQATDEFENNITFKADREIVPVAPVSSGQSLGPMLGLLMACGACSGIDIVMILEKQRQAFESLEIIVSGERETDKIPALWRTVDIAYHLSGEIALEKAERAAALSVEKYCSVLETLRRAGATVTFSVTTH